MTVELGRLRAGDGPMRPRSPMLRCRRLVRVAVQVTFSLPSMWMCSGSVAFLKRSGCTSLGLILLRVCSFAGSSNERGSSNFIFFELSSMERVCHWCSATALAYRRLPHTAQLYSVGNSVVQGVCGCCTAHYTAMLPTVLLLLYTLLWSVVRCRSHM